MKFRKQSSYISKPIGLLYLFFRCQENTYSGVFTVNQESGGLMQWAKELCPELNVEKYFLIYILLYF